MSESTRLWIRFLSGNAEPTSIDYDDDWKKMYSTFEGFRENFIRGWGGTGDNPQGEPCKYVIQDAEPDETTVWSRAPEFN